jgi:uncharacterized protein involved in outer membrane biogenesis
MTRALKILAGMVAAIVALTAVLLAFASFFDWNRAKPWVNDKVSAATGRPFAIKGDISFNWSRPQEEQTGWRRYVPWPHVRAQGIELGNADWAREPLMAQLRQADITLNPLALLTRTISVHTLILEEGTLVLEQARDNRNNWTFPKEDNPSGWQFALNSLAIKQGQVRYIDPMKKADATARIDTDPDGTVNFKLTGTFNVEPVSGGGKAGGLLTLMKRNVQYPVQATLKVGQTTITADGTLTDPAKPSALDVKLRIMGASMADLFPLSGLVLPETPKFSTEGHVIGTFAPDNIRVKYEQFKGRVGDSDIGGTLEYLHKKPRPLLRGEVTSENLWLKDMKALIGTDENTNKKSEQAKIPPGKVLPVAPFKTERWNSIDVQVRFTGQHIRRETLPIDHLETSVKMENGVLSLVPLNFGIAGGRLTTELHIDGRSDPAKARMKVSARNLHLKELMPEVESAQASVGQLHGDAELTAAGNSIATMLGSANGEVKALISQGSVSKFILEAAGLNIASAVIAKLFGDHPVQLNCMATDLGVTNGVAQTRTFLVDTKDASITADGNVNFAKETLDMTVRPQSKGVRLISLRSPLYVKGTFKKPDIGIDKGAVAMRAGAATALGVVAAPVAALLALVDAGSTQDSPCAALLQEASKKPQAPPPGKSSAKENTKEGAAAQSGR